MNGLAEFTRFWIVTRHYHVKGDLYQTTNPSSIHGLYTDHDNQHGWNRYVHGGYFMLFDLQHFWLHPHAQDYLYTILKSGYDVEQRWQEQGVVNMMMLLFISSEHKMVFSQDDIQLSQGILEMVANCTSIKVHAMMIEMMIVMMLLKMVVVVIVVVMTMIVIMHNDSDDDVSDTNYNNDDSDSADDYDDSDSDDDNIYDYLIYSLRYLIG